MVFACVKLALVMLDYCVRFPECCYAVAKVFKVFLVGCYAFSRPAAFLVASFLLEF